MPEIIIDVHTFTIDPNTVEGKETIEKIVTSKQVCIPNYKIPIDENNLRVGEIIRVPMEFHDSKTQAIAGYGTSYYEIIAIDTSFNPIRVYGNQKFMDRNGERFEVQYKSQV